MGRIHLFEFEDQTWFPQFLRNYMTDFLQFVSNKTQMYRPVIPIIQKGLEADHSNQIIDLASGGGGGLVWLNGEIKKKHPGLRITLTDYFPNISTFKLICSNADNIDYVSEPVDVRNVQKNLKGLRTQFLSFHHFAPEDARCILQNAVDSGNAIAIFEAQERTFTSLAGMFFSPVTVLLVTPFIRPFNFGRLLFTYLIPLVPIFVWWDGLVSSLRTYSVTEMKQLVEQLTNKNAYDWEINKTQSGPVPILYMLGTKKKT